jgi:hypothetical protein
MATSTQISSETSANVKDGDALYAIDERAYEGAGESYLFKVWERLCWSGQCRLCRRYPEGKPVVPGRTTQSSIYNTVKTCSSKVQFITPGMSLLEAVFRILIANRNQPMKFSEIVAKLQEFWGAEFPQRIESVEGLRRVLDGANEYRISQAPTRE